MSEIKNLQPQALWGYFDDICAIPHPSFHEEAIRAYVVDFAKANGLEYKVDAANNVIVRKPATPGMENRKVIVLQSHLDMVPQKNSDTAFDFEKDSIMPRIDGEWVKATGTTLGADNGIGAAAAMAVLASKELKHGAIEALFTATEETGMEGAFGLQAGELKGDIMLNLDSETHGELFVGCAGGLDGNISFDYKPEAAPASGYVARRIEIKGLKGGHSGIEIVLERANANKLLNRFLYSAFDSCGVRLASIDGGSLRNAIPREAFATVVVPEGKAAQMEAELAKYEAIVIEEFKGVEDSISIKVYPADMPATLMDAASQKKFMQAVCVCPNGIISMSKSMKGLVQTSTNLARIVSDGKQIKMQCLMRSSSNSEKEALGEMVRSAFELAGGNVELTGAYDGWNPNMDSPILATMSASYEKLFGAKPAVLGIHAGLECGIIGGAYPKMDMISFGPTICFPHSPDEKVNIASVADFWKFLCHTLETAPVK